MIYQFAVSIGLLIVLCVILYIMSRTESYYETPYSQNYIAVYKR